MSVTASLLKLFFGSKADKDRKAIQPIVDKILAVYPQIQTLSDDELRARVTAFKELIRERLREDEDRIAELKAKLEAADVEIDEKERIATEIDRLKKHVNETIESVLNEILPEVFAIVKDTARRFAQNETITVTATDADRELAAQGKDFVRIDGDKAVYQNHWLAGGNEITWDMIHYDVQLFGGVALHKGNVAEMATGEGKTLVATLPVFLNALAGKGVHVVTVNDYLARRDSEWMGPIYQFHGLTVDCIDKHQPNSDERRKAYNCDITFGTNNEFGFDYLRDNMAIDPGDLVQREHHYAIVDEVDSVLIDDARTPLIISGPVPRGEDQLFEEYRGQVESLYNLQRNLCTSLLAEARKVIAEGDEAKGGKLLLAVHKGLPKYKPLIKFLSEPGMKALMQKTENFYMQDNSKRMHEVTDDLYFVIDEKLHSVELTDKGHDALAGNMNDKRFFILPDIGSEIATLEKSDMTVEERLAAKDKLLSEYALKSERVHTVHQLLKAYALFEKDTEYVVMDNKVKIVDEQTGRILDGRRYSDGLHQAIEAKERVKVEAATQTFATITLQNYFRMYHKLAGMTGTAETEASELWNIYKLDVIVIPTNRPVIRKDYQDLIYKTKREKYAAVIDEIVKLVGEGRPVLVGTTSVEISELLSKMLKLRGIKHNVLNAKQHQLEAQIVAEAGRPGQVTIATNMAGRGTDIKLTPEVREAGGLAIIGTERHESRRVDRQLRGRAGRQGDPGSSQFFVSLEDDLMRLFGSERIARLMDSMGLKEGEVIQAGMMSRAIERAQKKVEENNFGIRKRLLEYDDVMNSQREVIYTRRHNAVFGERIEVDVNNMMTDFAETFIENYRGLPFEEFKVELIRQISIEPSFTEEEYNDLKDQQLAEMLLGDMRSALKRRASQIAQQAYPVLEAIYKEQGDKFENITIPLTDGKRGLNVPVNFKRAVESKGLEIHKAFSRVMMLITIDDDWKEHLRDMDDLKQSVQNAAYEQKDPLLIYKFESFELFRKMIEKINREVLSMLFKVYLPLAPAGAGQGAPQPTPQAQPQQAIPARNRPDMNRMQTSRNEGPVPPRAVAGGGSASSTSAKPAPAHAEKRVGRNDPCPCGSGKKYKNCHGAM
ncbi:MAG TPA: preprotein translocase subunit SecA [Candidatus Rikenella faecigallinarum]|uniref:Protein translocase subunit SecA n=1 Tax=Candidatus Rikenella faecigallinarum TaxID=2838745 RepID=A0A9D1QEL9_9BACT|nr:preprotein translocase subunit SecA [Candidatus Rikenella faecigallinarum]